MDFLFSFKFNYNPLILPVLFEIFSGFLNITGISKVHYFEDSGKYTFPDITDKIPLCRRFSLPEVYEYYYDPFEDKWDLKKDSKLARRNSSSLISTALNPEQKSLLDFRDKILAPPLNVTESSTSVSIKSTPFTLKKGSQIFKIHCANPVLLIRDDGTISLILRGDLEVILTRGTINFPNKPFNSVPLIDGEIIFKKKPTLILSPLESSHGSKLRSDRVINNGVTPATNPIIPINLDTQMLTKPSSSENINSMSESSRIIKEGDLIQKSTSLPNRQTVNPKSDIPLLVEGESSKIDNNNNNTLNIESSILGVESISFNSASVKLTTDSVTESTKESKKSDKKDKIKNKLNLPIIDSKNTMEIPFTPLPSPEQECLSGDSDISSEKKKEIEIKKTSSEEGKVIKDCVELENKFYELVFKYATNIQEKNLPTKLKGENLTIVENLLDKIEKPIFDSKTADTCVTQFEK